MTPRLERWTERCRQALALAQEEARALGHARIGTEHLLLGLLREEEGLAARALTAIGLTTDAVRAKVEEKSVRTDLKISGQIALSPRAEKVCELALREALSLGCSYIGTEHLLLGLIRENEGVAARILLDFDADSEKIRNEVIRMLSGGPRRPPAEPVAVKPKPVHLVEAALLPLQRPVPTDVGELQVEVLSLRTVLASIASGIPFRGIADPATIARSVLTPPDR